MNKYRAALLAILCFVSLQGCSETSEADQCLRSKLFAECMRLLPAGPTQTHYNDWSEVIEECGSQAYYQSIRRSASIALECR